MARRIKGETKREGQRKAEKRERASPSCGMDI